MRAALGCGTRRRAAPTTMALRRLEALGAGQLRRAGAWGAVAVAAARRPRLAGSARLALRPAACCFSSTTTGGAEDARRHAYRLMAKAHARSDEDHTPKPDAIDVLVEQVAAEKLADVDIFYWAVVTHAKTAKLRAYALRRLLDSMLDSGLEPADVGVVDPDEEVEEGEEPREPRTGGEVYGMLLHWLMKANDGHPQVLRESLDTIVDHGVTPDLTMMNMAIACHARPLDRKPARPLEAEGLIEKYMSGEGGGCTPDAETYELLARAYTRAPADQQLQFGAAVGERVLMRMVAAGVPPTTANLNAAIASYALAKPPKIDEVERILNAVESGGKVLPPDAGEGSEGVLPPPLNTASYNWLIHAYANAYPAPLPTNAAAVIQRMEALPDVEPDVVSYTSIVDAYAKAANFPAAKRTLEEMRAAGLEPGIVAVGAMLNAAKNAASDTEEGQAVVAEARQLFETLPMEERNGFVYSSMLAALGKANMKDDAIAMFEEAASHLKPW